MKPVFSKHSLRRIQYTSDLRRVIESHKDGRNHIVIRARFDIGRYLDRSKYPRGKDEKTLKQ